MLKLFHLYWNTIFTPLKVRVDLIEDKDLCSAASKRGKYRQELKVGPDTTRSVPFIIIPMIHGQFPIEVKAAVKDSWLSDGIMKKLLVVVRRAGCSGYRAGTSLYFCLNCMCGHFKGIKATSVYTV